MVLLPCVFCGAGISGLVEGTTVQCFSCGTTNAHLECTTKLTQYVQDILDLVQLPPFDGQEKLSGVSLENRTRAVREFFQDILLRKHITRNYVLVSKIDDEDIDGEAILQLAQTFGNLGIITKNFISPYVEGTTQSLEMVQIIQNSKIENLCLTGLHHAIAGRKAFEGKTAIGYYQQAIRNYNKIVELIESELDRETGLDFSKENRVYSLAAHFCELLAKSVLENPAYYSDEIEQIALGLKNIPDLPVRGQVLLGQAMDLYELARSAMFILEELRNANPLWLINAYQEDTLLETSETLENVAEAKDWLKVTYKRFKNAQMKLMRLHCGRILEYLNTHRAEFENRYEETVAKYDGIIETIINNSIADYSIQCVELFDRLEDIFGRQFDADTTISRVAAIRDELEDLDKTIKDLVFALLKEVMKGTFGRKLQSDLISAVSEQHSQYDSKILDYINFLFHDFMDRRNSQQWSMEKQREIFLIELKPRVKRLIDSSYTLREEKIPYPLLMELILLKTQILVEESERLILLIENPSEVPVLSLQISFLVPKTFAIVKRFGKVRLLKPHEKKTLSTHIIPTEPGEFHLMSMVQYEHEYEKYWLPSIKLKVSVHEDLDFLGNPTEEEEDDLLATLPASPEDRALIKRLLQEIGEDHDSEGNGQDILKEE